MPYDYKVGPCEDEAANFFPACALASAHTSLKPAIGGQDKAFDANFSAFRQRMSLPHRVHRQDFGCGRTGTGTATAFLWCPPATRPAPPSFAMPHYNSAMLCRCGGKFSHRASKRCLPTSSSSYQRSTQSVLSPHPTFYSTLLL